MAVSRARHYGKERSKGFFTVLPVCFPFIVSGVRDAGEIAGGFFVNAFFEMSDDSFDYASIKFRWSPAFHLAVSNNHTNFLQCLALGCFDLLQLFPLMRVDEIDN